MIRDVHPGSGFFPSRIRIPDPGVKKVPDSGSGSAILERNTLIFIVRFFLYQKIDTGTYLKYGLG
jgi:hypothetical protein